jgi:hypothetical protein
MILNAAALEGLPCLFMLYLCTDDIPETSRFLATANNKRFIQEECSTTTLRPASSPTVSGAFALPFHCLSVLGLIVVATF